MESLRSCRIGLLVVLVALSHEVAVGAQGVGNATGPTRTTTGPTSTAARRPAMTSQPRLSYNRLTTGRPYVVSTSSRTGATSAAPGSMTRGDSLHPYTDQMLQAPSGRAASEIPSSSTQQPPPESRPVEVQSAPHHFYPGMRTGQHPNANTAQISRNRAGVGARPICTPSRGASLAGGVRGR